MLNSSPNVLGSSAAPPVSKADSNGGSVKSDLSPGQFLVFYSMREKDLPFYLFTNRPSYPLTHHLLGKKFWKGVFRTWGWEKKRKYWKRILQWEECRKLLSSPSKTDRKRQFKKRRKGVFTIISNLKVIFSCDFIRWSFRIADIILGV